MKDKTCCFTGHRIIPQEQYKAIFRKTKLAVKKLIRQGYLYFCTGGALGFDTIAALAVLKLKKQYSDIRLIIVAPCISQAKYWNEEEKRLYEDIKTKADKIIYTSLKYTAGCMHKRNRYLVDNSSACICYLTENSGGTFYTAGYAQEKGLKIINVAKNQPPQYFRK